MRGAALYFLSLMMFSSGCSTQMPGTDNPPLQALANEPAPSPFGMPSYCSTTPKPKAHLFWQAVCRNTALPTKIALTTQRWTDLQKIEADVNDSLSYAVAESWDPLVSAGDCKTAAARMELELLERGWPAGALRLATAFVNDENNDQFSYHSALLVDTDHGTVVIDSRHHEPLPWTRVAYVWMTVELPGSQGKWARLPADPSAVRTAMAANRILMQRPAASELAAAPTPAPPQAVADH
jgi:predicted transglutaminase-like cysteine proteinase